MTDVAVFKFVPCQIRVGIEQDKTGLYDDKNRVSRIWHIDAQVKQPKQSAKPAQSVKSSAKSATTTTTPPAAAVQPTATAAPTAKPVSSVASGTNGNIPPWRQAKPSLSEDLNDSIPD